ncbi:MAG: hypothetical protein M0P74_10165 [Syntrophales bacterium]|jgi:hypothetical protein|nr:hypothetical protein [Syntrophales bacterium]
MSQITKTSLTFALLLFISVFALAGCGSSSSQSNFDSATGHPTGWLPTGHTTAAKANMETCAECHGADYQGGIAQASCTTCHIGNRASYHPTLWGTYAYALHGSYVKANGTAGCATASCHGANLDGVFQSGPSCTSCHIGGQNAYHPPEWMTLPGASHGNYVKANGTAGCATASCHGANLDGVFQSGPSCTACHIGGPTSKHPIEWSDNLRLHEGYVEANGISSCSTSACHGSQIIAGSSGCSACH